MRALSLMVGKQRYPLYRALSSWWFGQAHATRSSLIMMTITAILIRIIILISIHRIRPESPLDGAIVLTSGNVNRLLDVFLRFRRRR